MYQLNSQPVKPCPHCHSKELTVITNLKTGTGFVKCQNCGATGPEVKAGGEVEIWNSRDVEEKVKVVYVVPKGFIF